MLHRPRRAPAPPQDGGSYASLAALKDAYIKAGDTCETLTPTNVKRTAESGRCGQVWLETYVSHADAAATVQDWKDTFSRPDSPQETPMLVGQNWIIQAPDAAQLQTKLGGQLVKIGG
ncbi:hypothetical protein [Sinomonas soli]